MDDIIGRFFADLSGRMSGPMSFRFLLQPTVAAVFAIKAGLQDARTGRPAYFWAMLANRSSRRELVHQGWKAVAKVFTLALILDLVYQVTQLKWIYPLEALVVAFTLAFVPYLLLRGPVNRLARRWNAE